MNFDIEIRYIVSMVDRKYAPRDTGATQLKN